MVDIWGWVCAVVGSVIAIPQVVQLLRTRSSAGLSLLMWQLSAAASVGWVFHGIRANSLIIAVPNVLIALTGVLVVRMVLADRNLPRASAWGVFALATAAVVAMEYLTTPVLFGLAVLIPLAVGFIGQSVDIVRSSSLSGVSEVYVGMTFAIQVMWWVWGFAVGDVSILICSTVLGVIAGFNLVWLTLRTRGLVVPRVAHA